MPTSLLLSLSSSAGKEVMTNSETNSVAPNRCFYCSTPSLVLVALLALDTLLWLSERFQWFGFHEHRGWTVLIAVAAVGMSALVMLFWFAVTLIFRWRFQFSVRLLLVLIVAVAIPSSWLATEIRQGRKQREAVHAIEELGGTVGWDETSKPKWYPAILSDDLFRSAIRADINIPRQGYNPLPDSTLGLEHLRALTQLRCLRINSTQMTAAKTQYLMGLGQLQELRMVYVEISDADLEIIGELAQLRRLHFFGTDVSDAGLAHLSKLVRLESLGLYNTQVTDDGLASLEGMKHLRSLDLQWTRVTNAGLWRLAKLSELKALNLHGSQVTDDGLKKFQQEAPNCQIDR